MTLFSFVAYAQEIGIVNPQAPTIEQIVTGLIMLALGFAGLLFFAMLVIGGIRYISAGGDEKAVTSARQTLTSAFIGLIIVVASFLVANIIFVLLNIDTFVQVIDLP